MGPNPWPWHPQPSLCPRRDRELGGGTSLEEPLVEEPPALPGSGESHGPEQGTEVRDFCPLLGAQRARSPPGVPAANPSGPGAGAGASWCPPAPASPHGEQPQARPQELTGPCQVLGRPLLPCWVKEGSVLIGLFWGEAKFGKIINRHPLPKRIQPWNTTFPSKLDGLGRKRQNNNNKSSTTHQRWQLHGGEKKK